MLLYLLLGFMVGAAVVGAGAWWQQHRARQQLRQLTNELDQLCFGAFEQRFTAQPGLLGPLVASLNQLLGRLQGTVESQRRFVVQASHKLRTPLTIITGQIEVTLIKPRTVEQHEQTWRSVLQDIARLNQLSDDLLLLAQLRTAHLTPQPVALDEVLYQASARLKARRPGYQVLFEFAPQLAELAGPLTVPGDADLLAQAFGHLLENGCRFSSDQQVWVLLGLSGRHATIRLQNHGRSILPQELPHLFEPFFMGENARQFPGHGLGLTLAQRVVQLHQGSIELDPAALVGTIVTVQLPLA